MKNTQFIISVLQTQPEKFGSWNPHHIDDKIDENTVIFSVDAPLFKGFIHIIYVPQSVNFKVAFCTAETNPLANEPKVIIHQASENIDVDQLVPYIHAYLVGQQQAMQDQLTNTLKLSNRLN